MRKVVTLILSFTVLLCVFVFTGCAPKGDPTQVLNDYYQNIKDGNIEGAYDKLSEASKKNFAKEDFIKWQNLKKETSTLKEAKVEKSTEYKNKEIDGVKYRNAVEFNITEKIQDLVEGKETTNNYKRTVVDDNGSWKVYRGKENSKELIASAMNELAWMYIDGKNKSKDLNQAAAILNEAIKINADYAYTYYTLGVAYVRLGRYDESISVINTYLSKEKENKWKSDGYNVLGNAYSSKNDLEKAKECYNKALELNPNNQYAKTNLEHIK